MNTPGQTFNEVRSVVAKTLGIEGRTESMSRESQLAGLPEFDSMAVLNVMLAIEEHFNIAIEDEEITGDLFETLGTLVAFVESKLK